MSGAPRHLIVRKPIYASLLGLLLLVLGASALVAVPLEQAPEITIGVFVASVVYPGAGPEDIEREVSRPLEDKLRAIRNVEWIQTAANDGVSITTIRMLDGADMDLARRDVKKAVDLARADLPADAEEPVIEEVSFDDIPIIYLAISGPDDPVQLRRSAEDLRDLVEAVPGVSDVEIFGGAEREVRVRLDPERLRALGVDISMVAAALATQSRSAPAGAVDVGGERAFLVRTTGEFAALSAIGEVVVRNAAGAPVRLAELATIRFEPERRATEARTDGRPTATLLVRKEKGVSTIPTAEAAKLRAQEFCKTKNLELKSFLEQRRYIVRMLETFSSNALQGMILVVLVLTAFVGWRLGILISMAIPVSLLVAMAGLWVLGQPLSGVAVFGLVLVLGMVVDGAIVMGEVIDRVWRQGLEPAQAADHALTEVGRPVISSALTTVAAFVPMMFMPGVSGQFIGVLPKVVTLALMGSLLADHLLVPAAFAFVAARRPPAETNSALTRFGNRTLDLYARTLGTALRHRVLVFLGCGLGVVAAVVTVVSGAIGFEFFPRADTGIFWIDVRMPPGTRIETTSEALLPLEARVAQIPEVESRVATIGDSGRLNADVTSVGGGIGPEWGRVNLELVGPKARVIKQYELVDRLRAEFSSTVGAEISLGERREGPPQGAPVTVRISADRFEDLRSLSRQVEEILLAQPGARDVRSDLSEGRPEFRVELRRTTSAAHHGLTSADVSRTLQLAVFGAEVARYVDGDDSIKVRLSVSDGRNISLDTLRQLLIRTPTGAMVPVEEVADIKLLGGFNRILRRNYRRTVSVRAEVAEGYTSDQVRNAVRKAMAQRTLPDQVTLEYEGDNVERDRSFGSLIAIYPVALILIFIILVAEFGSFTQPLLILSVIPLSFIGAILGLAVAGKAFGFMAGVGLVALAGIVVNDAIVMVDAINAFRSQGLDVHQAALAAGRQRFRAVWLTTLTTMAGLASFSLALSDGAEFWQPLAITITAGLFSATALTLLVVPGFYVVFIPLSERLWSLVRGVIGGTPDGSPGQG